MHPNMITNLEEQRKSLAKHNVPLRFYHPANNRKIEKYFKDNEVFFTCEKDAYMSLDELVRFVESLKKSSTYDNPSKNLSQPSNEIDVIDLTNEKYSTSTKHKWNSNSGFTSTEMGPASSSFKQPFKRTTNKKNTLFGSSEDEKEFSTGTVTTNTQQKYTWKNIFPSIPVTNTRSNIHTNAHKHSYSVYPINIEPIVTSKTNGNVILDSLLECRNALAKNLHIQDPELFITTRDLKLIILHKPKTLEELRNLHLVGFSEEYLNKYGLEFVAIVQSYLCE